MNNQQFRRLVQESSSKPAGTPAASRDVSSTPVLGSRQRSSIPMTPRSIAGSSSFQQQLRERNAAMAPPQKKFKSSAAPKGSKLAAGYTDRAAQLRNAEEDSEAGDKAGRIKALEEMVKLGQMSQEDFEKVRDEILGGEVENTHLVKGLDWKLLKRVKAGEDVLSGPAKAAEAQGEDKAEGPKEDMGEDELDDELDSLEKQDVKPVEKEERVKKGEMAPPPKPAAGKKRTRDDILRELRETRLRAQAEKAAAQPVLGWRFKRVGEKKLDGPRIEIDEKGQEVLITVDEDGNVKRKVRKSKPGGTQTNGNEPERDAHSLLLVDKSVQPLGMDANIPQSNKVPEPDEDEDTDIFADAGADYDPLGGMDEDSESDSDSEEEGETKEKAKTVPKPDPPTSDKSPPEAQPDKPSEAAPQKRNYFSATERSPSPPSAPANPLKDPSLLSALQKANAIAARASGDGSAGSASASGLSAETAEAEAAKIKRRKEMLASVDRDADDMDMREEEEDDGAKLLSWDGKETSGGKGDKQKRKRGGKKKKGGDKESVDDVMKVLAGRRGKEE